MDRRDYKYATPSDPSGPHSHTPTPTSTLPSLPSVHTASTAPAFAPYHPSSAPSSASAQYFHHGAHIYPTQSPSGYDHRRASLSGISGELLPINSSTQLGGRSERPGHLPPLQATRYGRSFGAPGPVSPNLAHESPYTSLPPLQAGGRYDNAPHGTRVAYGDSGQGQGYMHEREGQYPQTAMPGVHEHSWEREPERTEWRPLTRDRLGEVGSDVGREREMERGPITDRHRRQSLTSDWERRDSPWPDNQLPALPSTSLHLHRYPPYTSTSSSAVPLHRSEHQMLPPGLPTSPVRPSGLRSTSDARTTRATDRERDTGRASPTKVVPTKRGRVEESDSDSGDEADKADRSKLEIKREKNRVKQRNLRLRRANLISDLESSNIRLTDEKAALEAHTAEISRKSRNLERYVSDLEDIMSELGYERQVAALQAVWGGIEYAGRDAAGVARGSIASSISAASAMAGPSSFGSMPPPRTRFPPRAGASSLSPKKDDALHVDTAPVPRRISTGSLAHGGSYFDSPVKGLTPGQTPNTADIAPSPRSLRIEDLLSPSALGPSTPGVDSRPSSRQQSSLSLQGFHLAKDQEARHRRPGDKVAALVPTEMPDFIPLNLNFKVEPWMMEGWLNGLPVELGDPEEREDRDDAWELTTVEDGMTFDVDVSIKPRVHPCVHIARKMLRTILPESKLPVSEWRLHSLEPVQQRILLSALSQLGDPDMRTEIARQQVDTLPPGFIKALLAYQLDPSHDLRLLLMPVAILRARIIMFLHERRSFDLTKFITHVLADARVFGDVGDADGWEMSQTFWDVWEGWFPVARGFCGSLSGHRRRFGHKGSTPLEIIMGEEQEDARMKGRVGRPEGWTMPDAVERQSEKYIREGEAGSGIEAE